MSENSAIEWTDATWNPVLGCSKVSEGCRNCYAINQAWMKQHNPHPTLRAAYEGLVEKRADGSLNWTGRVNAIPERLEIPLRWSKPKRIFVNSLSDLFHENVSAEFIARVWAAMVMADQHTYQILTKRPERMARILGDAAFEAEVKQAMDDDYDAIPGGAWEWPLPNVWLGTSTEDQRTADERIPHLLATPAAVRFLSCEPLLGSVLLNDWLGITEYLDGPGMKARWHQERPAVLDWVITGGESGPNARPMHPDWARSLRDQCVAAGVAFHFKQWGEYGPTPAPMVTAVGSDRVVGFTRLGRKAAGRLLDGVEHNEFPSVAGATS